MISTDDIKFSDDGTQAWLAVEADDLPLIDLREDHELPIDRPCDTCGGSGTHSIGCWNFSPCPDCHGGRHCFDIEVECEHACIEGTECYAAGPCSVRTLTVSVVPGMALPVVRNGICGVERHVVDRGVDGDDWHICSSLNAWQPIDPPAATKPGDWLVQLDIHQGDQS